MIYKRGENMIFNRGENMIYKRRGGEIWFLKGGKNMISKRGKKYDFWNVKYTVDDKSIVEKLYKFNHEIHITLLQVLAFNTGRSPEKVIFSISLIHFISCKKKFLDEDACSFWHLKPSLSTFTENLVGEKH